MDYKSLSKAAQRFTTADGEEFYIRLLSGSQLQQFTDIQQDKKQNATAWLACLTLANEDGSRSFSDDDLGEVEQLPGRFLLAVFVASCRVNRLRQEDIDALKKN